MSIYCLSKLLLCLISLMRVQVDAACTTGDLIRPTLPTTEEVIEDPVCMIKSIACRPNEKCVDTASAPFWRCECNEGYEFNGEGCVEINSTYCMTHPGICGGATCVDEGSSSSYLCFCGPESTNIEGITCSDSRCAIDSRFCGNGNCIETHISPYYRCECDEGYNFDGKTCGGTTSSSTTTTTEEVIVETMCWVHSRSCIPNGRCVDTTTEPFWRCECNEGYEFNGEGCVETNSTMPSTYCKTNSNPCTTGDFEGICVDSADGLSYTCECGPGYILSEGGCYDDPCFVDSSRCPTTTTTISSSADTYCMTHSNPCGDEGTCVDSADGLSYTCNCGPGYIFTAGSCFDSPCIVNSQRCGNGKCQAITSSPFYSCNCDQGYNFNGVSCF